MLELPPGARTMLGLILGGYLAMLVVLSYIASKKVKTEADYLVAGRRLPLFLAWGTLIATWFGAATMRGAAEAARDDGLLGVVLDPFACSFTLIIAGLFFARPLWRMKLYTMADFYRQTYGKQAETVGSVIQVVGYFGWIAAQYVALASVQHAYFGVPMHYGILIGAGITLFYTMIGGMWSVTLTDTAQIVIAMLGLVVLADATFSHLGHGSVLDGIGLMLARTAEERPEHLSLIPLTGAVAVLAWSGDWATGLFGNIPGQDLQQRVFAAKSENTAALACILAGIAYFLFGLIPVSLGLVSNLTHPGEIDGKILHWLASEYLNGWMSLVFVVSFVSIVVSTATSAVLAPAAILGHNLLGRITLFQGRKLLVDRLCVLLVAAGGVSLAYTGDKIMGLLDISLSIALAGLFVPLLMGLYGRPLGQLPAILAMVFGMVGWSARFLMEEAFLRMPKDATDLEYIDFVAQTLSSDRVGGLVSTLAYGFAALPADLLGLTLSFLGYFLGQRLLRKKATVDSRQ
jgi:solute:Na+ symporter, SSS family